jgi:hypothetical protein
MTESSEAPDSNKSKTLFGSATTIENDITNAKNIITDLLHTGDLIYGSPEFSSTVSDEIKKRNTELELHYATLKKDVEHKHQLIETHNRDFSDLNQGNVRTNESKIISIEDYTLFIFFVAYFFMAFIFIYTYTYQSPILMQGLGKSLIGTVIFTIIMGMLFYGSV